MASVLTIGSVVLCAHGGRATATGIAMRIRIEGQPALVQAPLVVAGCANPPPPSGTGPCVTAQFVTAATRVRSMGLPLLTDWGPSICTPTGTPLSVAVVQPRVSAS